MQNEHWVNRSFGHEVAANFVVIKYDHCDVSILRNQGVCAPHWRFMRLLFEQHEVNDRFGKKCLADLLNTCLVKSTIDRNLVKLEELRIGIVQYVQYPQSPIVNTAGKRMLPGNNQNFDLIGHRSTP